MKNVLRDACTLHTPSQVETARILRPLLTPVYGNLASCLREVGRDDEAARIQNISPYPTEETALAWYFGIVVIVAIGLYFTAKLALIRLLPDRFGHLKFP